MTDRNLRVINPPGQSGNPTDPNATDRRPPPSDLPAERALLGTLLTTPTAASDLLPLLPPDAFYHPAHETIWAAAQHLHTEGITPDHLALVRHLTTTDQLTTIGGHERLLDLRDDANYTANPTAAADDIRNAHLRRTALTALHRAEHQLHTTSDPTLALGTALDTLDETVRTALDPHRHLTTPTTWAPVDLTRVLAGEHLDPPPTMLRRTDGQPLLYDGAVHTISGESESGKTWLTLLAVLQLLAEGKKALFLDFEDRADRVIARLLALGATPTQIEAGFSYVRPDRPLDDIGRAQLSPHLHDKALVVLDGVTESMTMHGLDLNSNADAATYYGLLPRWIADHGPAVAMIDHVVKDKEQQGRFAIGAQHKLAGIDGAAYIVRTVTPFARGKKGVAKVDVGKDRPGHVREFATGKCVAEFTLDASRGDLVLIAELAPVESSGDRDFVPTGLMEKISRYVQLTPGLTKKAIETAIAGRAETKRLALELLCTQGYIEPRPAPRGAVHHFHVKPYYQPGQDPNEPSTRTDSDEAAIEAGAPR